MFPHTPPNVFPHPPRFGFFWLKYTFLNSEQNSKFKSMLWVRSFLTINLMRHLRTNEIMAGQCALSFAKLNSFIIGIKNAKFTHNCKAIFLPRISSWKGRFSAATSQLLHQQVRLTNTNGHMTTNRPSTQVIDFGSITRCSTGVC